MKKIFLLSIFTLSINLCTAQWTDSGTQLTTEDYVGIGTTSPDTDSKLTVNGAFTVLSGVERLRWSSKHSGETDHRNYLAPRKPDDSGWDWGQEFGYHHYNRAWYFDNKVGIGTNNPKTLLSVGYNHPDPINSAELFQLSRNADAYMTIRDNAATVLFGSTSGLPFIGSQSPSDFTIRTANTERVRITSTGNVGIGINNPNAPLSFANTTGNKIDFYHTTSGEGDRYGISIVPHELRIHSGAGGNDAGGVVFGKQSTSTFTEFVRFSNIGNVGVGTTTPKAKLHIKGVTVGQPILALDNTFAAYSNDPEANRPFTLRRNAADTESMNMYLQDTATFFTYKNDEAFNTVHFRMINTDTESGGGANANDNNVMSIVGNNNGGGVGIGTNNPGTWRLAVNGNIRAKEIVVETGWSDFVFESDYKLPTLEEVEQHIKDKGHLKDIPNAKEVEENGIQLGEMNAKLLQKIEELTLYLIEQHKEIKALKLKLEAQCEAVKTTN